MTLRLQPLDTLFFRDGKPFELGEETWADALFPPLPSVVHGALRTACGFADALSPDTIKPLTADIIIEDLFFAIQIQKGYKKHYPIPLDLAVVYKKRENQVAVALKPVKIPTGMAVSAETPYLLLAPGNERVQSVENGLMAVSSLETYLSGEDATFPFVEMGQYIQAEPKVGIARQKDTRSTDEGKLYRVGMLRSSKCQIGVRIGRAPNNTLPNIDNLLRLGAEGKLAVINTAETLENIKPPTGTIQKGTCFRVWLASPGFLDGYAPKLKMKATLLCGITGRLMPVGGWDMAARSPKPMRQAVPAGSVWHFRAEEDFQLDPLQGKSLSIYGSEQGFGLSYFGRLKSTLYD